MKLNATIRTPRGRDVAAACGQLRHAAKWNLNVLHLP